MHRLRATAADLHTQLVDLELIPTGGLAAEEVLEQLRKRGRGSYAEKDRISVRECLVYLTMQCASPSINSFAVFF